MISHSMWCVSAFVFSTACGVSLPWCTFLVQYCDAHIYMFICLLYLELLASDPGNASAPDSLVQSTVMLQEGNFLTA